MTREALFPFSFHSKSDTQASTVFIKGLYSSSFNCSLHFSPRFIRRPWTDVL